jgi:hypothetical protein
VLLDFAGSASYIQNAGMATMQNRSMIDPVTVCLLAPG